MTPAAPRIFLAGLMASGKTTVGHELAGRTGWPYVDNDDLLMKLTGRTGPELRVEGEDVLHDAELDAFWRVASMTPPLIAGLAGFVLADAAARRRMKAAGTVVWLRAKPATLLKRAAAGEGRRPEATSLAWIRKTARERRPLFEATADVTIDVDDQTPAETASAVLERLGLRRFAAPGL